MSGLSDIIFFLIAQDQNFIWWLLLPSTVYRAFAGVVGVSPAHPAGEARPPPVQSPRPFAFRVHPRLVGGRFWSSERRAKLVWALPSRDRILRRETLFFQALPLLIRTAPIPPVVVGVLPAQSAGEARPSNDIWSFPTPIPEVIFFMVICLNPTYLFNYRSNEYKSKLA